MALGEVSFNGHCAPAHVFKIGVETYFELSENLISGIISVSEQQKAKRFFNVKDRNRFLVTRFAVRNILSKFIHIPPEKINFFHTGNKKPSVSGIEFNVAHSGNLILIIVSAEAVGIDLEWMDPNFNYSHLTNDLLTQSEQRHMLESDNPLLNFYTTWTRKEALLKATGEGLVDKMNKVDVIQDMVERLGQTYRIKTFSPFAGQYTCSVASTADLKDIAFWTY